MDQGDIAHRQVSMNILFTGASGFIGSVLALRLTKNGHRVVPLRRASAESASGPTWNPAAGQIHLEAAGALEAVVHLAGEDIARRCRAWRQLPATCHQPRHRARSSAGGVCAHQVGKSELAGLRRAFCASST